MGYNGVNDLYNGNNYPSATEEFDLNNQKILEEKKREIEEQRIKIEQEQQKRKMIEKQLMEERLQIKKEKEEIEQLRQEKMEEEAKKLRLKKIKEEEEKKGEKEKDENDFYDMVLNFHSFEQLNKDGWNSEFTEIGKKKYDRCKNKKAIVIGIVGNKNSGKSYLLGRIMKMKEYENPNGFFITTSGISCVFPKIDNADKNFITLDTAGRDNPLLKTAIFEEENKNDKEKKNDKDKDDFIRKVARDQKLTEIALNDFIIQESNILISVLEQLSFNEQEMLKNLINQITLSENKNSKENLKKDLKKNKTFKKRLIVIHNLMNITDIYGINKFIDEVLLKSLTFSLTDQKIEKLKINIYKQNLYQDKKQNIEIIHLIVGNDKIKDIKEKFNEPAFEFIRNNITTQDAKKFDILEQFKNFIIQNSNEYFEGEKMKEDSLIIGKEETKMVRL